MAWGVRLLAVVLMVHAADAQATDERSFTRVRAADDTFRALIRSGDAQSPTFRVMVDEIQRSNAVVTVQFGFCAKGQVRSCVSHVGGSAHTRTIRILINPAATNNRLIATIAHELYHALEIIRDPEVTSNDAAMRLYRRIATGDCARGRSERCETQAALATEAQVLVELEGSGRAR